MTGGTKRTAGIVGLVLLAALAVDVVKLIRPHERSDFHAKTITGAHWRLSDARGRVPVVLNFFATW